jgi:hypothetical protein
MCFSMQWIAQLLIWAVIIGAVFAILNLIVPWALSKAGLAIGDGLNMIIAVLKIVLWAIVAIVVIVIVFDLISCLISAGGGLGLPRLGR